jgi:hypothetical protein
MSGWLKIKGKHNDAYVVLSAEGFHNLMDGATLKINWAFIGMAREMYVVLCRKRGPEKSYVYFQEFIPNDGYDFRIEIAGDYCIAMIRKVRKDDFRASGGHDGCFDRNYIKKDVLDFAFQVCDAMKSQSCALDIVRNSQTGELYLLENSYCYGLYEDEFQHGYWDRYGNFYDKEFDSRDWIIESVIATIQKENKR